MNPKYIDKLRNLLNLYENEQESTNNIEKENQAEINALRSALSQKDAEKYIKLVLSVAQVAQLIKIIIEFLTQHR